MKVDDAEREKRRASVEKHKSMKDSEKKKEKRTNLKRQALEERRSKQRREGEPEEESPNEDDGDDHDDDDDDSEGMAARLDRVMQGLPQTNISSSRAEASRGPHGGDRDDRQNEASPRRSHANTAPATTQGRAILPPRPPQVSGSGHRVKTSATGPLTRGCAAAPERS